MEGRWVNDIPNGAAGLYLLGQILERQGKQRDALDFYRKAVEQDPTLWCAFEKLCKANDGTNHASVFTD